MGTAELVVMGVLMAVVIWSSVRFREAAGLADVLRIERKIDYLLRHSDIDPSEAEAVEPSDEVRDLVRAGRKLHAVKKLREEASLTLREAKEHVDQIERQDRMA